MRWFKLVVMLLVFGAKASAAPQPIPDKLVVLTFDDAVKSHRTFVGPLLKQLGFGATFFVTHRWMDDTNNFMNWNEIAELHQMGFEIGNHSWTHADFSTPKHAARLAGELFLVDRALDQTTPKVPRPVSFAYCGNTFGPEAVQRLTDLGYKFSRRGAQPETAYGKMEIGATFDPRKHHPLLIPTTGDAYPNWTLDHFKKVVAEAKSGQAVVLQFHGAPDVAHPWVHTPPERLREYLNYLKENGYRCIAVGRSRTVRGPSTAAGRSAALPSTPATFSRATGVARRNRPNAARPGFLASEYAPGPPL
jgi:peptidoglycan-N-acetylglucosamine deacetylase